MRRRYYKKYPYAKQNYEWWGKKKARSERRWSIGLSVFLVIYEEECQRKLMSSRPRLFVPTDLAAGGPVALDEGQSKYLFRVMRLQVGDEVRVFNGRHGEWLARVSEILGKSAGILKVEEQLRQQKKLTDLNLLFAPLKKTRTDFVVEKATELGVEVIQPVITELISMFVLSFHDTI